jgi:hypothetical protein
MIHCSASRFVKPLSGARPGHAHGCRDARAQLIGRHRPKPGLRVPHCREQFDEAGFLLHWKMPDATGAVDVPGFAFEAVQRMDAIFGLERWINSDVQGPRRAEALNRLHFGLPA